MKKTEFVSETLPGDPVEAYMNPDFMGSPDARPLRILAEYLYPKKQFEKHKVDDTILFFGSARIPSPEDAKAGLDVAKSSGGDTKAAERAVFMSQYYGATRELSRRLTEWSLNLDDCHGRRFVICTGAGPGIMEAANRGARDAGGETIGLGITLPKEEQNNPYVTPDLNFEFHYFFTRKFWFLYPAKALVLMPGGFGTLDELFETLTLLQTRKMKKRLPVVLFGSEYWDKVMNLEALADFGAINPSDLDLIYRTNDVDDAFKYIVDQLCKYALPNPGKGM
ncbi:MAG: LOG family protein [Caulobacterales bacterium]|uniref:LOG family protein n=1 Tax=Glycocaulis sp. TaxID=1969725 RepID=UPI003F9FB64D